MEKDPRADNCKRFSTDANGLVNGVELRYHADVNAKYRCDYAFLIDEAHAGGRQVAACEVLRASGGKGEDLPYLCYPYNGQLEPFEHVVPPGNPSGEHMIGYSIYTPPNIGPLAIAVYDSTGRRISDVIGGLGTPGGGGGGRHISFGIGFKERTTDDDDNDDDNDDDDPGAMVRIAVAFERTAGALERIATKLENS